MATNKGKSPQKATTSSSPAKGFNVAPSPRGATTQVSANGLSKVVANAEAATGSCHRES